jgi:hypothetical protein
VILFDLRPPNVNDKLVLGLEGQMVMIIHNLARDLTICPQERQRMSMWGVYVFMANTAGRIAEFVDGEKEKPKDGSWEEIFAPEPKEYEDDSDSDQARSTRRISEREQAVAACRCAGILGVEGRSFGT